MSIEKRIRLCRLLDKMEIEKSYSQKLGLENTSTFHNRQIKQDINNIEQKGWD